MTAQTVRFIVLEDHPLVRSAIINQLVLETGDATIVYEGASALAAAAEARTSGADCAVVDLDLGDGSSPVENVRMLVELGLPVLVISALGDPALVRETMSAGALAYVSKSADPDQLRAALESTLAGRPFMSPEIAQALVGDVNSEVKLSDQERTALALYASGMKMEAVARRMGVSITTAQEYIKRVRAKYSKAGYSVSTKTDLYRLAIKRGLLT